MKSFSNKKITIHKIKEFFNYYFLKPTKDNNYVCDNNAVLEVVNLTKKYKPNLQPAINKLNFKVQYGEFHAFIGGNGAGKTTTIKSIIGAYQKFEGNVYIDQINNRNFLSKKNIGYIPEIARFPDNMSCFEYLVEMCKLSGLSPKNAIEYSKKTLKRLNMHRLSAKSPNTFSSGQKKKILLAQALVHNPKILIMDEPAANLDPRSRLDFFNTLKDLQKHGHAIFISSHILSELEKYADSCTILDGGRIVYTGKLSDLKQNKNLFLISLKNSDLLLEYLNSNNIKFEKMDIDNNFLVDLTNNNPKEILSDLNKIDDIFLFKKYNFSLEDIYTKYVIKGSVHTMVVDDEK